MSTLADAKTYIYNLLCSDPTSGAPDFTLSHVKQVYRNEPRAGSMADFAVTVSSDGMTADSYRVAVRVYTNLIPDAQDCQDWLDETMEAIERLLDQASTFGRGDWNVAYDQQLDAIVASHALSTLRDDY